MNDVIITILNKIASESASNPSSDIITDVIPVINYEFPAIPPTVIEIGRKINPLPSDIENIPEYLPVSDNISTLPVSDENSNNPVSDNIITDTPINTVPIPEPNYIYEPISEPNTTDSTLGVPDDPSPQRRSVRLSEKGGVVRYRSEERGAGPVPRRFAQINQVSVKRALKEFPEATRAAALKEMKQMLDKKVLRFVKTNDRKALKAIKTFMFIKIKYKSDGTFEKVKARLVANGPQQDPNSYTDEDCASPTAAIPFVFAIIAIAAYQQRHIIFIDVTGAYLNANIEDLKIHVIIDDYLTSLLLTLRPDLITYRYPDGTITAKLDRALYGTHEAALRWYKTLITLAEKNGFIKNPIDPCVLNKSVNGVQITMVIYVDDIMFTCIDMSIIDEAIKMFRNEFEEITVHDNVINSYFGMTLTQNTESVEVTMEGFI